MKVPKGAHRIAVLEDVENPTNIGAIFRSAAALSMDAVLLTHGCSDPLYRRAARVSVGTVFQIPWTFCDKNGPHYMDILHQNGWKTAALALTDRSVPIDEPLLKEASRPTLSRWISRRFSSARVRNIAAMKEAKFLDDELFYLTLTNAIDYAVVYGEFYYQAGSWDYPFIRLIIRIPCIWLDISIKLLNRNIDCHAASGISFPAVGSLFKSAVGDQNNISFYLALIFQKNGSKERY